MKSLLKALGDKHNPGTGKGCEARRVHVSTGGTHGSKVYLLQMYGTLTMRLKCRVGTKQSNCGFVTLKKISRYLAEHLCQVLGICYLSIFHSTFNKTKLLMDLSCQFLFIL